MGPKYEKRAAWGFGHPSLSLRCFVMAAETLRAFLVWNLDLAVSRVGACNPIIHAKLQWSFFFKNHPGRTSKKITPIDFYVRRNGFASLDKIPELRLLHINYAAVYSFSESTRWFSNGFEIHDIHARCSEHSRQQFQCKQQHRSFSLVCGADVQDVCAITLVESPWRWFQKPSVSSHWQIRRLSHSSAWTTVDSSEAQAIDQLWKEYSADPFQWWDNRSRKRSPRSPDFRHKVTRKVLWLDGWSTPTWVKTRFAQAESRLHNGVPADLGSKIGESAKTLAEAISVLKNRQDQGSYMQVLKWCWKEKDLTAVKQVHDIIVQNKMEQNVFLANNLLMTYIGCGSVFEARQVFDQLLKKDVISWNVMIGGYTGEDAMEIFNQMLQKGAEPNEITYLNILKASISSSAGKEVHECIRQSGLEADVRVATALLQMYAECTSIDDARQVFDAMKERNVITWTAMIGAYAKSSSTVEAYQLFRQMMHEGFKPNAYTYTNLLNAPARASAVREVHKHAKEAGLDTDLRVGNALVHIYSKSGSLHEARLIFDRMKQRDVITWTALIGGLAQHGHGHEAYHLLLRMEQEPGLKPNAITYTSILNVGAFELVKKVHQHASKAGFDSDLRVGSALIHMYSKSGCIDDARLVFSRLQNRDAVTYTAMIGGLAQHGYGQEALKLFRDMEVKPIETTFLAVLSACSHAGLVDEGRQIFKEMSGFKPTVLHYNCMVDLLGRAGHLEEAKLLIESMPVEVDEGTWGALLSACRTYGNIELGELAANERLKVLPNDASTYVLLSNIYAAAGKWEKVSTVRRLMQERGIRKQPGRSWIVVDNKVHDFVVGDKSHPESVKIYAELNLLTEKIKAAGYVPDTRLVLKNIIDEEDKELALCSHSEKLAIVYGLLRVPVEEFIIVYKNLRVCCDCHEATKFISQVTEREIVVRDGNRFHHFKDGRCSCGGYW